MKKSFSSLFCIFFSLLLFGCEDNIEIRSSPVSGFADGNDSSQVSLSETSITLYSPSGQLWDEFTIDLGADFNAINICSGRTIFGRSGSALCGSSNWTVTPLMLNASNIGPLSGSVFTFNAPADTAHNVIALDMGADFNVTNICSSKSILNLSGSAICQGASGGTNSTAANVLIGTYFWNSSGVSTQGTMQNRGVWNLTSGFPGAGYYPSVSNIPTSTDIRSGVTILGVTGDSNVVNTSSGDANGVDLLAGKKAWVDGGEITGTAINRGVINLDTTAIPGGGFFSSIILSLSASDICSGKSIFGNAGSALCNASYPDLVPSSMNRNRGTTQMSIATEKGTSSYAPGYRDIPDVTKDDDGYHSSSPIIKASRPTVNCGLSQSTIEARISDCQAKNPSTAAWNGATNGISSEGAWKLVTMNGLMSEVWRDERTGLLWSAMLAYDTWCRASGNAQTAAQDSTGTGYCDPGLSLAQSNPAGSICAEGAGLTPALPETWTANGYDNGKGNMGLASTPSVRWRLPTINDWGQAELNGIRFVLPQMEDDFWSASIYSMNRDYGWRYDGYFGGKAIELRDEVWGVRCVGR